MILTVAILKFFGFFRAGELTMPIAMAFDLPPPLSPPKKKLAWDDQGQIQEGAGGGSYRRAGTNGCTAAAVTACSAKKNSL